MGFKSRTFPRQQAEVTEVAEVAEAAETPAAAEVAVTTHAGDEPPDELAEALLDNAAAQAAWQRISRTHRREIVEWIEAAQSDELRLRRARKAVLMLGSK